jgi:hypothetical protein
VSPPSQAPLFSFRTLVSALLSPFPSEGVKYEVACDRNEVAAPQVTAGRPASLLRFSCHVCASRFYLSSAEVAAPPTFPASRTIVVAESPSSSSPRLLEIVGPFFTASRWNTPREPRLTRSRRDRLNYTWPDDKFSGNLLPRIPGILLEKRHSSFAIVRELSRILRVYIRGSSIPFFESFPAGRSISYDSFRRNRTRVADPDDIPKISVFFFLCMFL